MTRNERSLVVGLGRNVKGGCLRWSCSMMMMMRLLEGKSNKRRSARSLTREEKSVRIRDTRCAFQIFDRWVLTTIRSDNASNVLRTAFSSSLVMTWTGDRGRRRVARWLSFCSSSAMKCWISPECRSSISSKCFSTIFSSRSDSRSFKAIADGDGVRSLTRCSGRISIHCKR